MNEWISCKERLPKENVKVKAKNTMHESISWICGKNDLGKPAWCHESWEHADDFVTHWKELK